MLILRLILISKNKNMASKDFIQKAIKHPGALHAKAKRAGALKKDGDIKVSWIREKAKEENKTGEEARLALTLMKLRKKKKK